MLERRFFAGDWFDSGAGNASSTSGAGKRLVALSGDFDGVRRCRGDRGAFRANGAILPHSSTLPLCGAIHFIASSSSAPAKEIERLRIVLGRTASRFSGAFSALFAGDFGVIATFSPGVPQSSSSKSRPMSVVSIGFGVDAFAGDFFVDASPLVSDIFSAETCFKISREGIGVPVSLPKFIDRRGVDLRCVGGASFSSLPPGDAGLFIDAFDDPLIGDTLIGVFPPFSLNGDRAIESASCSKINVASSSLDNCIPTTSPCRSVTAVSTSKIVSFNDTGFSLLIFFSTILPSTT